VSSASSSAQTWMSEGGRSYKGKIRPQRVPDKPKTYVMPASSGSSQTTKILLTGKLQLPVGFQNGGRGNTITKLDSSILHLTSLSLNDTPEAKSSDINLPEDVEEDDIDEDSEEDEVVDEDIDDGYEIRNTGKLKETPEEKKLRKQKVKEEKRVKRGLKKQLKTAFKSEYLTQVAHKANAQDINSIRVFKYTV
jgi:hypothetical protein